MGATGSFRAGRQPRPPQSRPPPCSPRPKPSVESRPFRICHLGDILMLGPGPDYADAGQIRAKLRQLHGPGQGHSPGRPSVRATGPYPVLLACEPRGN